MVDYKLDRKKRIDAFRIAADFVHGFAHGGEVDDGGNAGEILQKHSRRHERHFFFLGAGSPHSERFDVVGAHETAVFAAQQIFKQDSKRKREFDEIVNALFFEKFESLNVK